MTKRMTKEEQAAYAAEHYPTANLAITPGYNPEAPGTWTEHLTLLEKAGYPTVGLTEPGVTAPTTPTAPVKMPTFEEISVPKPEVTPAPPYVKSPEQIAFEETFLGKLEPILEAEGYGIPEVTQAQMIQKQTDVLKSREEESLRVMRNTMERRGITNSGFIFAYTQQIKSDTSVAIASGIRDVQISSAFMKMASFEKAMGWAGQFLGYLSEQSQLAYAPEFITWKAEQEATLQEWQGKLDVYKMELNQAYTQKNYEAQAYWTKVLQDDQQAHDILLAEMEIEANQQAAKAEGMGNIFGILLGGLFSFLPGS